MCAFLFIFNFGIVLASDGSIFDVLGPLNWAKAKISSIFSAQEAQVEAENSSDLLVSQNFLVKTSPPDNESSIEKRDFVIIYQVQEGDTLTKIASDFGLSLGTVLWANNLTSASKIKPGQELKVLPVDGVLYIIKKGDIVTAIAEKYKITAESIIDFNNLPADGTIKNGTELVLPGGMALLAAETAAAQAVVAKRAVVSAKQAIYKIALAAAEKFFIIPVSGLVTQGTHNYTPPAIDIANSCGTPIFSAADGVITIVRQTTSRFSSAEGGYGNNIRIQHSNGSLSLYAHLLAGSILVKSGDFVAQGQKIAEIGGGRTEKGLRMAGAGRSSGCHLHFEVRNGINPFTKYRKYSIIKTPVADLAIDENASGAGDSGEPDSQSQGATNSNSTSSLAPTSSFISTKQSATPITNSTPITPPAPTVSMATPSTNNSHQ